MKFSPKAIVVGGITDVVLSGILGLPLTFYVVSKMGRTDLTPQNMSAEVTSTIHQSAILYALQILLGFGSSIVGGYVAARIAKHDRLKNAALASWLCVGIGVYSISSGAGSTTIWLHLLLIALTPLCYVMGAHLYRRQDSAGFKQA